MTPCSWLPVKTLQRRHDACTVLWITLQSGLKSRKLKSTQTNRHTSYLIPGMLRVNLYSENFETRGCVKYFGLHMYKRLTWKDHIKKKKKQANHKMKTMNWIPRRKSKLTLYNKLLLYKVVIIPIWTYGMS